MPSSNMNPIRLISDTIYYNHEHSYNEEQHPLRFLMLFQFIISTFTATFNAFFLTSVTRVVSAGFDIDLSTIELCVTMATLGDCIMIFHANWVIMKLGQRYATVLGFFILTIGSSINILSQELFLLSALGSFINGIGYVIIINTQPLFCNNWFNYKSRPLMLAITSLAVVIGNITIYQIPQLFITTDTNSPKSVIKGQVFVYTIFLACCNLTMGIVNWIIFRDFPPIKTKKIVPNNNVFNYSIINHRRTNSNDKKKDFLHQTSNMRQKDQQQIQHGSMQSQNAHQQNEFVLDINNDNYELIPTIKFLLGYKIYIFGWMSYFFNYGTLTAFSMVLTEIQLGMGISQIYTSIYSLVNIVCAIIGSCIYGWLWIHKRNQIYILEFVNLGSNVLFFSCIWSFVFLPNGVSLALMACYGMLCQIQVQILCEEMLKICHFIGMEKMVAAIGVWNSSLRIMTAAGSYFWGLLLNQRTPLWSLIVCTIVLSFFGIGAVGTSLLEYYLRKEDYYEKLERLRAGEKIQPEKLGKSQERLQEKLIRNQFC